MGFFTRKIPKGWFTLTVMASQSLSGWDGVFHFPDEASILPKLVMSQSLSGWDGVFHTVT